MTAATDASPSGASADWGAAVLVRTIAGHGDGVGAAVSNAQATACHRARHNPC